MHDIPAKLTVKKTHSGVRKLEALIGEQVSLLGYFALHIHNPTGLLFFRQQLERVYNTCKLLEIARQIEEEIEEDDA